MSGKRALIICNDDYAFKPLPSCAENVKKFADAIKQDKSFKVDVGENFASTEMSKKISDFVMSIQRTDVAIFYFSGYLETWRDQTYLLPKNYHSIGTTIGWQDGSVNVQVLIDDLVARNTECILFILDCCHVNVNPWLLSDVANGNCRSHALSRIELHGKILFLSICEEIQVSSALPKQAARGEFTKYLLKHLTTPSIAITKIFNNAIKDFKKENNNQLHRFILHNFPDEIFLLDDGKFLFSRCSS